MLNSRPIILCYHRISDTAIIDINKLSVSPKNFRSHLVFLSQNKKFVSLQEIVEAPSPNTVALTFDDGYRDNYSTAANILSDLNIPASFFLATRFLENSTNYYPSSFNSIWNFCKSHRLIPDTIKDSPIEELILNETNYFKALRKLSANRPNALWDLAKILDTAQRDLGPVDELELPMSLSEIASLVSSDLFSIGPHTATHPRMSSIPIDDAISDFAESITTVMGWGGTKSQYFPYPFGQRSDFHRSLELQISSTFDFKGLSTVPMALAPNQKGSLTLPRLSVQNWELDTFRYILNVANLFSYVPIAAVIALKASSSLRRLRES